MSNTLQLPAECSILLVQVCRELLLTLYYISGLQPLDYPYRIPTVKKAGSHHCLLSQLMEKSATDTVLGRFCMTQKSATDTVSGRFCMTQKSATDTVSGRFCMTQKRASQSHWLSTTRRGSAGTRLLGLQVQILPGVWIFLVSVVCWQVEVSGMG
jgi:hypothetical protein